LFHPLRRIRAILSLGVTGLLFALAMLPLKSTDFIDFSLLPFLYILPFIVVLLLLTAIIDACHSHRFQMRLSNPAKEWRALPSLICRGLFVTTFGSRSDVGPQTAHGTIQGRLGWILISGLMALLGLWILCREYLTTSINLDIQVWQFGAAITLAGLLSLWWGRRFHFARLQAAGDVPLVLKQFSRVVICSLVSQVLALISFSLILRASGADTDFTILLAGAAVVCFAAALPIGLNGWGVRELAALFVFGISGVSPGISVLAAITFGLGQAVASALILALFQTTPRDRVRNETPPESGLKFIHLMHPSSGNIARTTTTASLVLWFGLFAAILLFFQFKFTLGGLTITLNLADPIALGFLATGIIFVAFRVNVMFRLPRLAWCWLAGMTIILGLTFLIGVDKFGVTSWALTNRLAGWVVLMGYAVCGAAIITVFGAVGRKRMLETILATTVSVVLVHSCARLGYASGLLDTQPPLNFEGFATNRNSFAFQTLIVFGLCIATFKPNKQLPGALFTVAITILIYAILQSGSLTGIISTVILSLILGFHLKHQRRRLLIAAMSALVLWKVGGVLATEAIDYIQSIMSPPSVPRDRRFRAITHLLFIESSITARLLSVQAALQAFLQNPVFGAGLGWGIHSIMSATGEKIVIHSTYLWILAETGLVGFIGAFWYPCMVLLPKVRDLITHHSNQVRMVSIKAAPGLWALVISVCFGLFSITHEIGYQRLLWLMIGAACAIPIGARRSKTAR
jgi:O-antigen ligase|tara:strand:- start:7421 stop:9655 length:2235 start_codon:yes stop_codon:yes gene_type:complete